MATVLSKEELNINPAMPNHRLRKDSAAVHRLTEKFEKGEITGAEDPKEVWLSDTLFQNHKLSNFRTCYNNVRTRYQTPVKGM